MTIRIPILLSMLLSLLLSTERGGAEVPQLTAEQLVANATDIVLGVVEARRIDESEDEGFRRKEFVYRVRVEEVEKGDLERGDLIEARAWNTTWVGPGEPPAHASGHAPLPLKGELAKFHLTPREPDGRSSNPSYDVLLPNGIELAIGVDETDPIRRGEAPPPVEVVVPEEASEGARDPFGWDVVLLLLATPLVVGSMRQKGRPRWILLAIATVMLAGAVAVVLA